MCVNMSPNAVYLYSATLSLPLLPDRSSALAWPMADDVCVCPQTQSTYRVQLSLSYRVVHLYLHGLVVVDVCLILQTQSTYTVQLTLSLSLTGSFICTCMAWWRMMSCSSCPVIRFETRPVLRSRSSGAARGSSQRVSTGAKRNQGRRRRYTHTHTYIYIYICIYVYI